MRRPGSFCVPHTHQALAMLAQCLVHFTLSSSHTFMHDDTTHAILCHSKVLHWDKREDKRADAQAKFKAARRIARHVKWPRDRSKHGSLDQEGITDILRILCGVIRGDHLTIRELSCVVCGDAFRPRGGNQWARNAPYVHDEEWGDLGDPDFVKEDDRRWAGEDETPEFKRSRRLHRLVQSVHTQRGNTGRGGAFAHVQIAHNVAMDKLKVACVRFLSFLALVVHVCLTLSVVLGRLRMDGG